MRERDLRRGAGLLIARTADIHFDSVSDPRAARGKRWRLASLLMLVASSIAAGCKSLAEVERLSENLSRAMRRQLGIARRVADTTLRNVLCRLDVDHLLPCLHRLIIAAHRRKSIAPKGLPFGVVAMDGKATSVRACDDYFAQRQSSHFQTVVRTVTVVLTSTPARPCINMTPIPASTNEMGIFPAALQHLHNAYGRHRLFQLVTYDAGATSEYNARFTRELGYDYLFALRDERRTLLQEARHTLGARLDAEADATTEDLLDNERTVTRRVYITYELAGLEWDHLRAVLCVQSVTKKLGVVIAQDDRYFVSSVEQGVLTPAQWLAVVRSHWGVENNCHHTLDTAFKEDDKPFIVADPKAMLVVAVLRRIVYSLLAIFRAVTQRADERRAMPWKALIDWMYQVLLRAQANTIESLRGRAPATE